MNVQPQSKTIVEYALLLSEEEARSTLVDPEPLQRQLRQALAGEAARRSNGHRNLTRTHRGNGRPKAIGTRPSSSKRKPIERVQCENCKRSIGKTGLTRHLRKCLKATAGAAPSSG